jgi:hypothetical protein
MFWPLSLCIYKYVFDFTYMFLISKETVDFTTPDWGRLYSRLERIFGKDVPETLSGTQACKLIGVEACTKGYFFIPRSKAFSSGMRARPLPAIPFPSLVCQTYEVVCLCLSYGTEHLNISCLSLL